MKMILLLASAYVAGAFFSSALIVRFAPRSYASRQVRRQLATFLVVPLLLVVDMIALVDGLGKTGRTLTRRLFEILSGRSLYASETGGWTYFGYRGPRSGRRVGNRQARRMAATASFAKQA